MCESQKSLDSIQNAKKTSDVGFLHISDDALSAALTKAGHQETHTRNVLVFLQPILKYLVDFCFLLKMGENSLFSLLTSTGLH